MGVYEECSSKRVLIIDDMPEMRSTMRTQLSTLGITKVNMAGSARDAIEQLKSAPIDIVVCDYNLGKNTDGQQLLEYVRGNGLIARSVIYLMVTAESGYGSVITAAECLPDDYLIKPFTAENLKQRIERLIEKKSRLSTIDKLWDAGQWSRIIQECEALIAAKDKYALDALRIKGNALLASRQFAEAKTFYQKAIEARPVPWAQLGLAKALHAMSDIDGAKAILGETIAANKSLLAAYDLLGRIHHEEGSHDKALDVLDDACKIAPNSLARQRAIAGIAEESGDFQRVEAALNQVIQRTRHTPLRSVSDFAKLGTAIAENGDPAKAISLLDEARLSFKEGHEVTHLAAVEAVAHRKAGNHDLAMQALETAMKGTEVLSDDVAMAMAKACLANGKESEAIGYLKNVIQNNPDAKGVHDRVTSALKDHGREALSESFVVDSVKEIIALNNDAVKLAQSGQFAEASQMLLDAAARLPNNLQIVANASFCLALDVFKNGMDPKKLSHAKRMHETVLDRDRNHPKLGDIAEVMSRIAQKYT